MICGCLPQPILIYCWCYHCCTIAAPSRVTSALYPEIFCDTLGLDAVILKNMGGSRNDGTPKKIVYNGKAY